MSTTKKNRSGFEFDDWMKVFKTNLSQFVDQPTEENLKSLMKIAEKYKDGWIMMASQDGGLGDKKPSSILSKEFLNSHDTSSEISEFLEDKGFDQVRLSTEEITELFSIPRGKRVGSSKPKKIGSGAWARMNLIRTEIDRVESSDKKTKLLTNSLYFPKYSNKYSGLEIEEQEYIQHSIRASRDIKNQQSDRILNRRWYFEQSKGKKGKVAWWCDREEFERLLAEAKQKDLLDDAFDDKRLNDSGINYVFSADLDLSEKEEYIKNFALESERDEIKQDGYYFCVAEMQYPKAFSQMFSDKFYQRKTLWRDIMIWSGKKVTIRSVTNDKYHKPSEHIPNSHWVISNDMTSIPNQVMNQFGKWLVGSSF